jgi:predicted nucleotidyltransferase
MSSRVDELLKEGLISPPPHMKNNVHYEVQMGSEAYGVSSNDSDIDLYGFCIPPKDMIFPHLRGEIAGFSTPGPNFNNYQEHHIKGLRGTAFEGKEYDISIHSIISYFKLCMDNNPNMIDSLFVPIRCVLHITKVGQMVREARKSFLHKGLWHKFKGYAFQQLSRMQNKQDVIDFEVKHNIPRTTTEDNINIVELVDKMPSIDVQKYVRLLRKTGDPNKESKRWNYYYEHGYDTKFAYHVVRLVNEAEQMLTEGDLDLERSREQLKAIRSGQVSLQEVKDYFALKERSLEEVYNTSSLPYTFNESAIRQLLLACLEEHYGSLDKCVVNLDKYEVAINDIKTILGKL